MLFLKNVDDYLNKDYAVLCFDETNGNVYFYDNRITELELIEEIQHLKNFYKDIVIKLPLPTQIRKEELEDATKRMD